MSILYRKTMTIEEVIARFVPAHLRSIDEACALIDEYDAKRAELHLPGIDLRQAHLPPGRVVELRLPEDQD